MSKEFLHKDPEKALDQVKQKLYDRLKVLRTCLIGANKDDIGYVSEYDMAMYNEIDFLEGVLDDIEKR